MWLFSPFIPEIQQPWRPGIQDGIAVTWGRASCHVLDIVYAGNNISFVQSLKVGSCLFLFFIIALELKVLYATLD